MTRPVLIIINGLPGSGKTTLSKRLAEQLKLPVFSRDGLYETLYDSLNCEEHGLPPHMGQTAFTLLYTIASSILASGHSLIVEGFFGNPSLRSAEFRQIQSQHNFTFVQILCKAEGQILLERFRERMDSSGRHGSHRAQDQAWLEQHRAMLLQGMLAPLPLEGPLLEITTSSGSASAFTLLLEQISALLTSPPYPA